MSNIQYFLVYDETNTARVREVFEQNGVFLVKSRGKVKTVRLIGYENIDPELKPGFAEIKRPIYKIVGEAAIQRTV